MEWERVCWEGVGKSLLGRSGKSLVGVAGVPYHAAVFLSEVSHEK